MARKSKKGALFLGAVTLAVSGIAAYKHRKEIEDTVQIISDQIAAKLEEEAGFFAAEKTAEETAPETAEETNDQAETAEDVSAPPVVDEADLAD